jgi:hypothetical protein
MTALKNLKFKQKRKTFEKSEDSKKTLTLKQKSEKKFFWFK